LTTRNRRNCLQKTDCQRKSNLAEDWAPDLHAWSQDLRRPQFLPDLLLHLQVLEVQREVPVIAAVLQCEPGHRQPQGSNRGFVPGGTQ
jgi:hypothetical protein